MQNFLQEWQGFQPLCLIATLMPDDVCMAVSPLLSNLKCHGITGATLHHIQH